MNLTNFYTAIDKEPKYYGLKLAGILTGIITAGIVLILWNMPASIIASIFGYGLGSNMSSQWHAGKIQRWCYWYLPIGLVNRNKYLPPSHIRKFM